MDAATNPSKKNLYGSPPEKQKTRKNKARKQVQKSIRYPSGSNEKTQKAVQATTRKIDMNKLAYPYKYDLAFLETGEVSLFKNKNYQVSVSIALGSLVMRHSVWLFDNDTGQKTPSSRYFGSLISVRCLLTQHVGYLKCIRHQGKGVWNYTPSPLYECIMH